MWLMISDTSKGNETNVNQLGNETGKNPKRTAKPTVWTPSVLHKTRRCGGWDVIL